MDGATLLKIIVSVILVLLGISQISEANNTLGNDESFVYTIVVGGWFCLLIYYVFY